MKLKVTLTPQTMKLLSPSNKEVRIHDKFLEEKVDVSHKKLKPLPTWNSRPKTIDSEGFFELDFAIS